jgi:hypothetical protein
MAGSDSEEFGDFVFEPSSEEKFDHDHIHVIDNWTGNQPVELERDKSWDLKLFHAVRGNAPDAVARVQKALVNDADANWVNDERHDESNLAWALGYQPMEPAREEVAFLLLRGGAKFRSKREQCSTFCKTPMMSHELLQTLLYSDMFSAVDSKLLWSNMQFFIVRIPLRKDSRPRDMLREYIHLAKIIFYNIKEKTKKGRPERLDDMDAFDEDSDDDEEEFCYIDDFLSRVVNGTTLLHQIVEVCLGDEICAPLIRCLINEGARLNVKDRFGRTPTDWAVIIYEEGLSRGQPWQHSRSEKKVIEWLKEMEVVQADEALENERRKIELFAMTIHGRMSAGSMLDGVDPEVINCIVDEFRAKYKGL